MSLEERLSRDDFAALLDFVIRPGGDTDTIGAMAGGILGALGGVQPLPGDLLARLEARERLERLAQDLLAARP